MELAIKIRAEREQEFKESMLSYRLKKDLTYKNIDYSNKLLKFEQNKTKGHSSASGVVIPLNDGLLSIIGEPPTDGNKDVLIFNLPSYESCCKSVKRWVKRAGIDKLKEEAINSLPELKL